MDPVLLILIQIGAMVLFALFINWLIRRKSAPAVEKKVPPRGDARELIELRRMRERSLSVPLSEMTRPVIMGDIVGQQQGIRALRAALCGPNPQHVIIYGPPGVGKTCAARLVLEEAKKNPDSPFHEDARFVEIDATCVRFDERSIADPLMGSVHDPIYQGAGTLGTQGVPQPKPGAVSRAHCGILFLDEIGELHPVQMNKLLKVLEDRRVLFESAYYSAQNKSIPAHIHDIFQNGFPADFRLVGATTRQPEELPSALRSRCMELYFNSLLTEDLMTIAATAAQRIGYGIAPGALRLAAQYAGSGRDVVNILQLASGAAYEEGRQQIREQDVKWVARTCNYTLRQQRRIRETAQPGMSNGLGVAGPGQGVLLEIECRAEKALPGQGTLVINGMVEEEELELRGRKLRRKSTARSSVENVLAALEQQSYLRSRDYDIHINIPGGVPMDGPSAGTALAVAVISALNNTPPRPRMALTGEVSIHGDVLPVGGVPEKVEAAVRAGAQLIVIPRDNDEEQFAACSVKVQAVATVAELLELAFDADQKLSPLKALLAKKETNSVGAS